MGLALGITLKFYTSVTKGLKLKVRKFLGLIPTFVEVTGEKFVGVLFAPLFPSWVWLFPSWIGLRVSAIQFCKNHCKQVSKFISSNHDKPPRRKNLGRTIKHQRNDRYQPTNPEMRAEISVLLLEYQLSENAEKFLLFDSSHDDDWILTFATDQSV